MLWHIPVWWKVWKWPEYLLKWWRGFHEVREAKHRADKAQEEASVIARANQIEIMKGKILTIRAEIQKKHPGINLELDIQPSPSDDVEIFYEAMNQLEERRPTILVNGR